MTLFKPINLRRQDSVASSRVQNYPVFVLSLKINLFEIFSKHAKQMQTDFICTLICIFFESFLSRKAILLSNVLSYPYFGIYVANVMQSIAHTCFLLCIACRFKFTNTRNV